MPRPLLSSAASIDYPRDAAGDPQAGNGPEKKSSHLLVSEGIRVEFDLAGAWDVTLESTIGGVTWTPVPGASNLTAGNHLVDIDFPTKKLRLVANAVGTDAEYSVVIAAKTAGDW